MRVQGTPHSVMIWRFKRMKDRSLRYGFSTAVLSSSHYFDPNAMQSMPRFPLCYRFENPARPLPNRTLGGTKLRDDIAPVRSAMVVSGCSEGSSLSFFRSLPSSGAICFGPSRCFELCSPIRLARRRDSLLGILVDDLRLLCGPSFKSDRLPSMPSLVMPKK
jgi:hypothetical protein